MPNPGYYNIIAKRDGKTFPCVEGVPADCALFVLENKVQFEREMGTTHYAVDSDGKEHTVAQMRKLHSEVQS